VAEGDDIPNFCRQLRKSRNQQGIVQCVVQIGMTVGKQFQRYFSFVQNATLGCVAPHFSIYSGLKLILHMSNPEKIKPLLNHLIIVE